MEITEWVYLHKRADWRKWLKKHHKAKEEVWLVYPNKASGKPRIPYHDAVDEAICFGWIDSTAKKFDKDSGAQRFSPRNPKSSWSELNKERARRLIKEGKMHKSGAALLPDLTENELQIPSDIMKKLKADKETWDNFQNFTEVYKKLKIGWITATKRNEIRKQRLDYFLKMTKKGKKYGWH
jgi:uncharacterized protein YdeI (YjbR/CyaY-like superfamily)